MSNKFQYSKLAELFLMFLLCLFCGCGQIQREAKEAVEPESEMRNPEENAQEEAEDFSANDTSAYLPDNEAIRESIYSYYGRKEDEEISGEELEAAKGKLEVYFRMAIHSGEEFALMREWYDWDNLDSYSKVSVVFSEDLTDWREEDLEALKILKCNVSVESSGETVPVRALSYLTGATNLGFSDDSDITDVSGTMPEGRSFPQQIKRIWLNHFREGKYKALLQLLQDSQVEYIHISLDDEEAEPQGFWLDDAAAIPNLKEVYLLEGTIRVQDKKALDGCMLERITGKIDQKTDCSFVDHLSALESLDCDVMGECALQPLLEREGLSFYLRFYKACPDFYQAVSWPEDEEGDCMPFGYQRIYDEGRMAECFIGTREGETDIWEIDLKRGNPLIRVTDGEAAYEIKPGEDEEHMYDSIQFIYMWRAAKISFYDVNFDGRKDLLIPATRNGALGPTGTGFAYLWDQESGRYEFCPSYRWIDNPDVDEEQKMIRSERISWPDFYSWEIYRYEDGAFVLQSMLTEEPLEEDEIPEELAAPEGFGVMRWQEEIFENGETVEVKNAYAVQVVGEKTTIPPICKKYYAKDSYWADFNPDTWESNQRMEVADRKNYVAPEDKNPDEEISEEEPEEAKEKIEMVFSEDVSATMFEGTEFPKQIKEVTLQAYREGKYTELLRLLQDSQVEKITVRPDPEEKAVQRFWLDEVAGIDSLEELILEDITIRVRETASLSGCPLKRIEGYVDAETDLGFVEVCAGLEAAECGVLTEMDLSPFLEKRDLSLYLYFCRQIAESEERGYEGESYVVCPAFCKAVSWPGEPGDERFPAIYQRGYDQGRMVECFTERFLSYHEEKISNMWSFDPWIRVTDGSKVYELKPGQEEGVDEEYAFGSFRTDRMSLVDINFDGVKDIALDAGGFGNQMLNREFGWTWNRSTAAYEYEPTYLQIGNPSVDQEHQIVRSFWRNSAGSHGWAIYRYTDGAFEIQSELTEDFLLPGEIPEELAVPEDVEVIRWQETVFENGEPAEVKNAYAVQTEEGQNVYPKVYESYYAPDSYWGSPDD